MKTTRCTDCGSEFTDAELVGARGCPVCKTESLPSDIKDDVTIKLNWHELRILGIWASNWANEKCPEHSKRTLKHILARIQAQHPDKTALTLFGEVQGIVEKGVVSGAQIHHGDGSVTDVKKKD
ncbi:MAG: hypothetical protein PVSMB1_04900 [Gemmatimonadaceae bacterium]